MSPDSLTKKFRIANPGPGPCRLAIELPEDAPWLSAQPRVCELEAGAARDIVVQVERGPAARTARLRVFLGGETREIEVHVPALAEAARPGSRAAAAVLLLLLFLGGSAGTWFYLAKPAGASRPCRAASLSLDRIAKDDRGGDIRVSVPLSPGDLMDARVAQDPSRPGSLALEGTFSPGGAAAFAEATREAAARAEEIEILVNGKAVSRAFVRDPILNGRFSISGNFSRKELEALAASLCGR